MNILVKLTKRNLKLNKKRAIGTIIGIMLSVALICAVSGMFTSFRETLIQNAINERGYFHIALETITREDLKKYKLNKDIKEINVLYELGETEYINPDINFPYATVYSIEKEDFSKLSYTLEEGSFPTNSNEVIISKKMALYSKVKVGDYIELNIGEIKIIDEDKETEEKINVYIENPTYKKYKVVGISYRAKNSAGVYAITTGEVNDKIHAYISLKNPKDYERSFMELLGANNYDEIAHHIVNDIDFSYSVNDELLRWEAFKFSDYTISAMSTVAIVVITIIMAVSVFCIRNSFAISTTEKMKMYGMLASVGATKKQIKKSVLIEGLLLGLIGIPLGILCGIIAVFILIQIVNSLLGEFLFDSIDGLVFKITILPIIISILLGLVTIYFSSIMSAKKASRVSPIDNLRSSNEIKIKSKKLRTPKIISNLFKTGGVIAYKNLKRSKSKYRTTIISLTVSIFVFISVSSFINEGASQAERYYMDYDYNIIVDSQLSQYNSSQIKTLRNLKNIKKSYMIYKGIGTAKVLDDNKINKFSDYSSTPEYMVVYIYTLDSDTFKNYAKEVGLDYKSIKDKGILIDELKYYSMEEEKYKIVHSYSYKKDDTMNLEFETSEAKENVKIKLASVTDKRPVGLENIFYDGGFLIINKEYYKNIEFVPYQLMIDTNKPEDVIKDLKSLDDELNIINFDEQARAERSMIIVVSIFLYGFITVITLIGVTNIFNTLTSNMELRQKEFAMLKSVGMTKKEFNRMINLETLFYCSKSLLYGIILGLIGSYSIHYGFSKNIEMAYQIPVTSIIISIVFVFIIVYIIMKYSMNKINKQNTIETIRKENV